MHPLRLLFAQCDSNDEMTIVRIASLSIECAELTHLWYWRVVFSMALFVQSFKCYCYDRHIRYHSYECHSNSCRTLHVDKLYEKNQQTSVHTHTRKYAQTRTTATAFPRRVIITLSSSSSSSHIQQKTDTICVACACNVHS